MKTESHQFRLRLPIPLKQWVEREAKTNYTTLNGQIVSMLVAQQEAINAHKAALKKIKRA